MQLPKASFKTRIDAASRSAVGVLTVSAGDLQLRASCSDDTFINGPCLQGLSVGVEKEGSFVLEYDVGDKAPKFQFMSSATIASKSLHLTYNHHQKRNCTGVEAALTVDHRNKIACSYDFSSRGGRIKYAYAHDDGTVIEPTLDLGNMSWDLALSRKITKDDSIKATYRGMEKSVGLDWSRSGRGGFRVYAHIPLDNDSTKSPKLMVEKTWNC